ncbi:hypothetical protein [Chamaesiphon sp. VAR_48_metabat_403]|uniref:hypothetical protein n=1 Tax=Chamaesiphon sp. VAR_48_metabat_403 TaxID=2964700 RepID=UPI00286DED7C|nr:hypothetical protein [Chamaesiphon sp. VAR_48_metabat_403]
MYTVVSLKAEHKTLAAAKAFHKLKASSWAALVEKLSPPVTEPTIKELQAQITKLKQQLADYNTGYQSDYFKSAEAELIYSIVKLDGEERTRALHITGSHYRDAKKAKSWRNEIAARIHPDKCTHRDAQTAISEVTEMYKLMVA